MAMVINLFVAATAGTLVPLGLKALKVDPALGSSVFITTFTDVVGFASFLGLATVFLRYLVDNKCRSTRPKPSFFAPTSWAKPTALSCS